MTSFSEMGVRKDIAAGLAALGFQEPTPIQAQAIPAALDDARDLVALAPTGTGKTAAFGIPILQLADLDAPHVQALVLCPTRELCIQVAGDIGLYAGTNSPLRIAAVYGGAGIQEQIKILARGVHVVVATPGRLNDLIGRRRVDLSRIRMLVLDEADEMLQMGFQEELNAILEHTPEDKTTFLFSATMPPGLSKIASGYLKDPLKITVGRPNAGAENIRHLYYLVQAKHRYATLKRLADHDPEMYAIVFCRTRLETKEVAEKLMGDGHLADALHGDLSQSQRDWVMGRFRRRQIRLLVATDVAARGLDVEDLTHVVHYTLPDETAVYTHRSGRTGRAGKAGLSVAIINMREKYKIRTIEKRLGKVFQQDRVPTGEEILRAQARHRVGEILAATMDGGALSPLLPEILEAFESMDREELVARFLRREMTRYLSAYQEAPDLNAATKTPGNRKKREAAAPSPERRAKGRPNAKNTPCDRFTRFLFNVGKRDGVNPGRLIGRINDVSGRSDIRIGKIKVMDRAALLEADSHYAQEVVDAFQHLMINGRPVSVSVEGERLEARRGHRKGPSPKNSRNTFSKRARKKSPHARR